MTGSISLTAHKIPSWSFGSGVLYGTGVFWSMVASSESAGIGALGTFMEDGSRFQWRLTGRVYLDSARIAFSP